MKRIATLLLVLAVLAILVPATSHAASACTTTGYSRDGHSLTAAQVNPSSPVTGPVDATGCDIGVYFSQNGSINGAEIFGAKYFGVVNNGATVSIRDSEIHDIGEDPFNGAQHGVAVYFVYGTSANGIIANNTISNYQKGGIVINGADASAEVYDNTVTGLGAVSFIAQNGIQFGWKASGTVRGNTISANWYTGCSKKDAAKTGCTPWESAGLLLYDIEANAVKHSNNKFIDNQRNLLLLTSQSLSPGPQ